MDQTERQRIIDTRLRMLSFFTPPNGGIYHFTGKDSPQKLTASDFDIIVQHFPDYPEVMLGMMNDDIPELNQRFIPDSMTAADFQRLMLSKLAQQNRPTDIFRPSKETDKPEPRMPTTIGGETLNLKKSEAYAVALNTAVLSENPEQLTEGLKKLRESNANLPDVAIVASGYAAGAIPAFNPRLNPDTKVPLSINIGDANTTPADIQNWYCSEIQKPFQREGNDLDAKTAYTLGFIQARTDARNNFQVSGGVGITEPCPPAQTPNTSVANGNGTSAAPKPGGGNANAAPKGR